MTNSLRCNATWIVTRGTADIRWRVEMPATQLGIDTIVLSPEDSKVFQEPNSDSPFRWQLTDDGAEYFDVKDTVIWTRPDIQKGVHAIAMSETGHRVVAEVDDNYLSPAIQNLFMRQSKDWDTKGKTSHMLAFAAMDAIICSTEILRDVYAKTLKREVKRVPDLHVARNHVDPDDWQDREPLITTPKTRLRVGWAGSHQHVWDLRLAAPALHLAKTLGAEIVLIGLDPADHDPMWREFLGDYTHIPWTTPESYHTKRLNLDIGLVPLVMNSHTLGKSDVKCLEYAMSGAAIVAQNNPVYNRTWRHNETCLLAGGPDEMAYAVRDLVTNHRLRKQLAEAGKEYVLKERTIQGNLHEWADPIAG